MSDNDGCDIVRGRIRRQMMVRDPLITPLDTLKMLMVRDGLSVSEAVRKYTNIYGLPPTKDIEALKEDGN